MVSLLPPFVFPDLQEELLQHQRHDIDMNNMTICIRLAAAICMTIVSVPSTRVTSFDSLLC